MGGFFAIRRESLLRFAKQAAGFKIVFETIVRGRKILRVREVPIVFRDRARGMSKMSLAQAMRFALAWLRAIGQANNRRQDFGAAIACTKIISRLSCAGVEDRSASAKIKHESGEKQAAINLCQTRRDPRRA